jgi:hypothetical protein
MSKTKIQDAVDFEVKRTGVMDAEDGLFFARELEHVKAKTYDKKYGDIEFREVMPISHECPEGATSITVRSYDRTGIAKIINGYATDLPRVDISGKEYTVPVKQTGDSYGYTTKEIRESKLTGKSLDARRASAAMRSNEELLDRIAFDGDEANGLFGLATVPGIPVTTVSDKASGGTTWLDPGGDGANATPAEILFDMNNAVSVMVSTTKKKEKPTEMWMPVAQYQYIASTARSDNSDTTILQYFLDNNQHIKKVIPLNKLDGFGTAGVDVLVICNPDPDNFVFEIPMEFKQHAPQLKGLTWSIPCESETGGLNVYYPLSLAIWEGI